MITDLSARSTPGNLWQSINEFFNRGGFTNGLIPRQVGRIWYVGGLDPNGNTMGGDGLSGRSPSSPLATIAKALTLVDRYDVIVLAGVFREQVVTPTGVYDVTILGAGNKPRQATTSGTPNGGGSSWLAPTSPTALTPLIDIREQGWVLSNFQMAPVASSSCIRLSRVAGAAYKGASHTVLSGMYLSGGGANGIGLEDYGGCAHVLIEDSRIESQGDTAILGLNTNVAIPLSWMIRRNKFQQNVNDIKLSLSYGIIRDNDFMTAGSGSTNKVVSTTALAAQGGNNHVRLNQFSNTAAQIQVSNGYTGAASDTWANYVSNQAALVVGQPGA